MYENIFFNNFFLNFFLGFSFLIINVLFSVCLSKNSSLEKKFFFKEFQPIIIFFLFFCFYSFLLNILIILDYHYLFLLIFFTFFLQIIYTIKNFGYPNYEIPRVGIYSSDNSYLSAKLSGLYRRPINKII